MPQSQWIVLLIAATIAGVVLVRLYLVLGRRTGMEQPSGLRRWGTSVPAPQTPAAVTEPDAPGLAEIRRADKSFDAAKFLDGARTAYGLIVSAFEKGDRDALRPLLSAEVYDAFGTAIAARSDAAVPFTFASVRDARITAASVQGGTLEITVTFVAGFDPPAGAPHDVTDIWTFAKAAGAANPNWTLVATSGEIA